MAIPPPYPCSLGGYLWTPSLAADLSQALPGLCCGSIAGIKKAPAIKPGLCM